jgi:hypothetical protein
MNGMPWWIRRDIPPKTYWMWRECWSRWRGKRLVREGDLASPEVFGGCVGVSRPRRPVESQGWTAAVPGVSRAGQHRAPLRR